TFYQDIIYLIGKFVNTIMIFKVSVPYPMQAAHKVVPKKAYPHHNSAGISLLTNLRYLIFAPQQFDFCLISIFPFHLHLFLMPSFASFLSQNISLFPDMLRFFSIDLFQGFYHIILSFVCFLQPCLSSEISVDRAVCQAHMDFCIKGKPADLFLGCFLTKKHLVWVT